MITIIALSFNTCNHSNTNSITNVNFILSDDSSTVYRLHQRFFMLIPGDTALFYGSREFTITTNGVLDSTYNDSIYFRTITFMPYKKIIDGLTYHVYPQHYQYFDSFDDIKSDTGYYKNTITRHFIKTDTAILQIQYTTYLINNNSSTLTIDSLQTPMPQDKQKVIPKILEVGGFGWIQTDSTQVTSNNMWYTSPLIRNPLDYSKGSVIFEGSSFIPKGIGLSGSSDLVYIIHGNVYQNGVFIKTKYSIEGEIFENNVKVMVKGVVSITRTYFSERGMIDQLINIELQKDYDDKIQIIQEKIYVARGPEGAQTYYDTIFP